MNVIYVAVRVGNAYRGVGLSDLIRGGIKAAAG